MYLRELLQEEIISREVENGRWEVFDTDKNKRIGRARSQQDANRMAGQFKTHLTNPVDSNQDNNARPADSNNDSTRRPNKTRPRPRNNARLNSPVYLGNNKFQFTSADGASYTGTASEVVDKMITYVEGTNPKRAAQLKRSRARYIKFVNDSANKNRFVRWMQTLFNKFGGKAIPIAGSVVSSALAIKHLNDTIADIEFMRENFDFGAVGDPSEEIIKSIIIESVAVIAIQFTPLLLNLTSSTRRIRQSISVFRAGAVAAGPKGWLLLLLSEIAIQGGVWLASRIISNHAEDWVNDYLSEIMVRAAMGARKFATGGSHDDMPEEEEVSTEDMVSSNKSNIENTAKGAVTDETPPKEKPIVDKALQSIFDKHLVR